MNYLVGRRSFFRRRVIPQAEQNALRAKMRAEGNGSWKNVPRHQMISQKRGLQQATVARNPYPVGSIGHFAELVNMERPAALAREAGGLLLTSALQNYEVFSTVFGLVSKNSPLPLILPFRNLSP
uniref:Uncharacterized protein n=1 Tax=Ascaris lumbricoides TaxID=6252 RepID=A0A0M3HMW5_ASCLU